jgi:diguanylate cyclase (GGDEF)-like protein/PAS domain S-box-containing protein
VAASRPPSRTRGRAGAILAVRTPVCAGTARRGVRSAQEKGFMHPLPTDAPGEIARLRELVHHNTDWIWEVDAQGRYTFCSEGSVRLLGRPPSEVLGRTAFDFMPPDEAARVGREFAAIAGAQRPFAGLIGRSLRPDGSLVVRESSGIPLLDAGGAFCGYRGIDRDVTPLRGVLSQRLLQLETIYAAAPVALALMDHGLRFLAVNDASARIHRLPIERIVGRTVAEVVPGGAARALAGALRRLDTGREVPDGTFELREKIYHVRIQGTRDAAGQLIGLTTALTDITEHLRVQQRLAQATEELARANQRLEDANRQLLRFARQDHLTELPNRRWFGEVFAAEVEHARRHGRPLSVAMVDIDHFKQYNDRYGHLAGDACLRRVADALRRSMLRAGDLASRYGGEEFALVLPDTTAEDALVVARRVIAGVEALGVEHLSSPWGRVTASAGIATLRLEPQVDPTPAAADRLGAQLLGYADQALYRAKRSGRNQAAQSPEMREAAG